MEQVFRAQVAWKKTNCYGCIVSSVFFSCGAKNTIRRRRDNKRIQHAEYRGQEKTQTVTTCSKNAECFV